MRLIGKTLRRLQRVFDRERRSFAGRRTTRPMMSRRGGAMSSGSRQLASRPALVAEVYGEHLLHARSGSIRNEPPAHAHCAGVNPG